MLSCAAFRTRIICQSTNCPPPLDSPLPTPSPTPLSPEAEIALRYIAEREGIAVEQLEVAGEEPITFRFLAKHYTYVTLLHLQKETSQLYSILVDPITKAIEPDYNAIKALERAAHFDRYGKLEPALYDRLQKLTDEEEVLVAIWLAHSAAERTGDEIYAAVIARYPAAGKALAESGVLWDVDDPQLSVAIQVEFERLITENTVLRSEALSAWLQADGFSPETISGMPVVQVKLPKRLILAVAQREDVARIDAADGVVEPASDIGVQTDRAPVVWNRGYTGTGVRVAILEHGNINGNAANCITIAATRTGTTPLTFGHKNRVAAVAACNNSVLRGMASGASIVDAGHNNSISDIIEALKWATDPNSSTRAYVVNESESIESDGNLHHLDHAYDYWVRIRNFTAVIAAGNNTTNVRTPAVAYNVIAVGNVDDKNTTAWADDAMNSTSARDNPTTGVQKPEVAAPGTAINTVDGEDTGTSYAAPQVAGLSAILIQRNSNLSFKPTAIKAIIMASALHNVEGNSVSSAVDGAGSIDVAMADWIAQTSGTTAACAQPCWWQIPVNNSTPAAGSYVERTFSATRGERIRVAIAWFSDADPPTETSADTLRRNFDLLVLNPDGSTADLAVSTVNNFEVVEFRASQTGIFKIRATRNSSGDGGNEPFENIVGMAWVKDATYLPDVRNNTTVSTIYIRNNDVNQRLVNVTYLNADGTHKQTDLYNINGNGVVPATPPGSWNGSAIIEGAEGIVAVVRNSASGTSTFDNAFTSLYNHSDYAFEQAATVLYAPAIYNNIFSGLNSLIYVQNTSSVDNLGVTVNFYGRAGYGNNNTSLTLAKGGSGVVSTSVFGSNPWVGSAVISASRPLAVKIYESQGSGTTRSFNASAAGRSLMYVPAAYRTYGATNFNSGLVIQNLSGGSTNVGITYCNRDFTNCVTATPKAVSALSAFGVNVVTEPVLTRTPNWTGSVKVESTPAAPLAVAVTNSINGGGYDFNANNISNLRYRVITLPYVARVVGPSGSERTTGYTIRNIHGSPITVRIKYYNMDGTLKDASRFNTPVSFATGEVIGYHQGSDAFLANGWEGSVVLESTGDIIAMVREDTTTTTAGYNGIPR